MASCDDLENKTTVPYDPCICCFPPYFGSQIILNRKNKKNLLEYKIDSNNLYSVLSFNLWRKKHKPSSEDLFIFHIDYTADPMITLETFTYTDQNTGEQREQKVYRYKYKKYNICSSCASLPNLEATLKIIFYIPLYKAEKTLSYIKNSIAN